MKIAAGGARGATVKPPQKKLSLPA